MNTVDKIKLDADKIHYACHEIPSMIFKKRNVLFLSNTATCSTFSLDQVLVKFYHKKLEMEITYFEMSGKMHETIYPYPTTPEGLIRCLLKSCPKGLLYKQMRTIWAKAAIHYYKMITN